MTISLLGFSFFSFRLVSLTLVSFTVQPSIIIHPPSVFQPAPEPSRPPEVPDGTYVPRAKDRAGLQASMVIFLLTDEYRWEIGYYETLNRKYKKVPFSSAMKSLIDSKAKEVICIGASSEELEHTLLLEKGEKKAIEKEEWRAGRRAETLGSWLEEIRGVLIPIRKLNVGHWMRQTNDADTSEQRRVIIVLVLDKQEGIKMDEAFLDALDQGKNNQKIYGTILNEYSLTRSLPLKWMDRPEADAPNR
jgi:hypothetical protein